MNDRIQKLLKNEEIVLIFENEMCPDAIFFISKRTAFETKHCEDFPLLVRGYDRKRHEVYDKFFACSDLTGAKLRIMSIRSNLFY